jgi:hypothetical protein
MSNFDAIRRRLEEASGRRAAVAPAAPAAQAQAPATHKAPSRGGKVHIDAYLDPNFKRSLRLVQAQTGKDVQSLIARALNDLFQRTQRPSDCRVE